MVALSNEFLLQLAVVLGSCAAMYGAMRADLKSMHAKIEDIKAASDAAHRRLDQHLDRAPARR